MLLLCIFLVSCRLPGSMGSAVEEFQANLEALPNKEVSRYLFFFISYSSFGGNKKWSLGYFLL